MMSYEDAVDQYMHGYCMFMAAALHHRYGFKIGLASVMYSGRGCPNGERLSHAWVKTPDGHYLDIQGLQSLKEMTSFFGDCPEGTYTLHEEASLEYLEKLSCGKLGADEYDVRLALKVAQEHLKKELRKWE